MNKIAKNTIWNLIGSFTYYFSQWLMTVLVVRLSGSYEEAGIYGLANSVCNIFAMVSSFSVRTYQVTDIDNKFSNGEYVTFRFITCGTALLILPVYLIIMGYSPYIFFTALCFMLIKTCEALTDVIHGIFQKDWRLDIACRSLLIRGIANLAVFSATEYLLKNLVLSLLLTAAVSLILALIIDFKPCFSMYEVKIDFKDSKIWRLCLYCVPMFLHGILSTLIANIPRLYGQSILGEEMFGFYSSVAAPAVVVQFAAGNLFGPCVPILSEQLKAKDRAIFKTILRIAMIILGVGIVAVLGFYWLGDWFLELIFGGEILPYTGLLIPAIIASVLTAAFWFVTAMFTVVGKNILMVILESAVTVAAVIVSPRLINAYGLQGINWGIIGEYLLFIMIGGIIVLTRINIILKRKEI